MKSRESFRHAVRILVSSDAPARVLTAAIDQGSIRFEVVADEPPPESNIWSWNYHIYGEDDSFHEITGDADADVETIELVYFNEIMSQVSDHYLSLHAITHAPCSTPAATLEASPSEEVAPSLTDHHFSISRDFDFAPFDSDRWQTTDAILADPEVTNGTRAQWAAEALLHYRDDQRRKIDDDGEAMVDLICNLLHLAHLKVSKGLSCHPNTILDCALMNFEAEAGVLPNVSLV